MRSDDVFLALVPLIPSIFAISLIKDENTLLIIVFSVLISTVGFLATNALVPVFSELTLKRGLGGKDFGKRGTDREDVKVPEALGIVCGIVYLVCTICAQLTFAKDNQQLVIYNSALFSICFMIFLGFMDDTLDLKWRYKLILPTIASLPLLVSYSGSTAMYIPKPFTSLLMQNGQLTTLGSLIDLIVTVDTEANGSIVELKYWFLLFMGLQSVFCTNAINILAGINGLECGQSYVIACSLLFFKLYEITTSTSSAVTTESGLEHSTFAVLMLLPFIGTALGLLRHNWFPANVFVGDTFCYFSGMTFAVIGIHSHFSKTLLMLFIPQIFNFLYSVPQLFKFLPCPRHRLPNIDLKTRLMNYSYFECKEHEYKWFKVKANDTHCPNCTIICAVLRIFGPMTERSLCIVLLTIQLAFSALAFYIRYFVLENK